MLYSLLSAAQGHKDGANEDVGFLGAFLEGGCRFLDACMLYREGEWGGASSLLEKRRGHCLLKPFQRQRGGAGQFWEEMEPCG